MLIKNEKTGEKVMNMNNKRSFIKNKANLIFAILVIAQVCALFYWGTKKQGFWVDELWSYGLSNSYYQPHLYSDGSLNDRWVENEYFHNYLTVQEGEQFSYDSVFYNQINDEHPPLFYMALHTISSFNKDGISKWFGIIPNIIYFIIAIIGMYSLSKKIFRDDYLAIIPSLIYGFSVGNVANVIYIRMYVMLTMWVVLLLNYVVGFIQKKRIKWYEAIGFTIVCLFGCLTHYYFFVVAAIICGLAAVYMIVTKKWKCLVVFSVTGIASQILMLLIFSEGYKKLLGMDNSRGAEATKNLFDLTGFKSHLSTYIKITNEQMFNHMGTLMFGIFLGAIIYFVYNRYVLNYKQIIITDITNLEIKTSKLINTHKSGNVNEIEKENKSKNTSSKDIVDQKNIKTETRDVIFSWLLIGVFTLIYFVMTVKIAPYQVDRYIFCIYPMVIILAVAVIFWSFLKLGLNRLAIIITTIAIFIIPTLVNYKNHQITYLYENYANNQNISEKYSKLDCLYICDTEYIYVASSLELADYNSVYHINLNELETIEGLTKNKGDSIIVYVDRIMIDSVKIMEIVIDNTSYNKYEKLYDDSKSAAFLLTR